MSISGFISSGRHHHEAARNTGVYNQGFKSVLSAGAAEFEEDVSVEPQLVNAIGANYNWTQLKYPKSGPREISWVIPPSLTENFLDGTVKLSINWNASIGGNVAWDTTIQTYALGDDLDKSISSSARTLIGTSPGSSNNAIVNTTTQFVPLSTEIKKGELIRVILKRDTSAGTDTLNGDANVLFLSLHELI